MFKTISLIFIFSTLLMPNEKENILNVLEDYNKAFGEANYSQIVSFFDYPTFFNLKDKTIIASSKFKLKLIYKKIRGSLPDYYSYSKWGEINIQLIDDKIAIVDANFLRYKNDNTIFESGSAKYHLRLEDDEWKIFGLTPYKNIEILN